MPRKNYVRIPRSLASVTSIDRDAECPPESVGMSAAAVDRIWHAVEGMYRTGTQPAITIMLRRQGKAVMSRAIGHARGNEPGRESSTPMLARPDTPICLFSASKAISALLVHKLVEDGKLSLSDRVADYIPEYAQQRKGNTTVRQLLAHRAGIPSAPVKNMDHRVMYDWDQVVGMLCAAKPFDLSGDKQAYHAITGGFIIGELVRRISGLELSDALRQWIAEPLGCRYMTFGLAKEHRDIGAPNVFTGPRPPWMIDVLAKRVLGAGFKQVCEVSNEPEFLSCPIPAGNIFATADETSRVYQMLLNGGSYEGRQVFKPGTVRELVRPVGRRQFDGMLVIPIRFSAGLMLGDTPFGMFGPRSSHAFGHLGFMNILAWADPVRDISVAVLNNGKSLAPSGLTRLARVLHAIGSQCEMSK